MNRIVKTFEKAFKMKKEKNWDRIYVLVDLHGTIFVPTFSNFENFKFYENAKEALQMMSKDPEVIMILWTSTYPEKIRKYLDVMAKEGIVFSQVNKNTLEDNTDFQCFREKPYFNVGLDDAFGFDPEVDWKEIIEFFKKQRRIER